MSVPAGAGRGASRAAAGVREALLLEEAERTAAGYAHGTRDRMRAFARAGAERALVAEQVAEGHPVVALGLYREAALFHMAARVTVGAGDPVEEPLVAEAIIERFRALPARRPPPCAPDELEVFYASVAQGGGLRADADRAADVGRRVERAQAIVRWLATLVEPREPGELRFARRFRTTAAAVLAVVLVVGAVRSLLHPTNIASHKPVTTSSVHPASIAPPGGLTDGVIEGPPYGVHTNFSDAPWVQVDLEAVYLVEKVVIYNRNDGRFDEGLPMILQVSEDGSHFVDVDTRTKTFSVEAPWVAKLHDVPARYLRVRGARGKYVALSELEAFGRRRR